MIRMVRILGALLIACGVVVILAWLIEPVREVLPVLYDAFRAMPGAVQFGLVVAAIGFLLLVSSLIWERLEDRKHESGLLDEE